MHTARFPGSLRGSAGSQRTQVNTGPAKRQGGGVAHSGRAADRRGSGERGHTWVPYLSFTVSVPPPYSWGFDQEQSGGQVCADADGSAGTCPDGAIAVRAEGLADAVGVEDRRR
jgi:hypothetical protein